MFATALIYLTILLAIFGLSFVIENIWLYCLKPKNSPPSDVIIYLQNDIAHSQIRSILEEQKWQGKGKINKVYAVTNNITDDELTFCKSCFNTDIIFVKKIGDTFGNT